MTKHIGIVACSAEGAALCYRTICAEAAKVMGSHAHPEISLHSHSLSDYMAPIERGDWAAVSEIMLSSANKLKAAGVDFLICPDNTIHQAMMFVDGRSPLPWLHIAKVVAEEAAKKGYRRLALTGTRWLVESGVYPEQLTERGIEYCRPRAEERAEISRIIMDELTYGGDPYGVFRPESVAYFQQVIARLKEESACDAVVLGCTEMRGFLGFARNDKFVALDVRAGLTPLLCVSDIHRAEARCSLRSLQIQCVVVWGCVLQTHVSEARHGAPVCGDAISFAVARCDGRWRLGRRGFAAW